MTTYEGQIAGDVWEFPTVKSINSHGKETAWQVIVKGHGEKCDPPVVIPVATLLENKRLPAGYYATFKVNSGLVGGVIKNSPPTVVTIGKNLGKKNETNVFCQAMNEARGKYDKQLRIAATPISIRGVSAYPPMLAQEATTFAYPVYLQCKYDGLRAVAALRPGGTSVADVVMYTRTRMEIPGLQHIKSAVFLILQAHPTWYLDGEIYKHGMSLQIISGLVREETPSEEADQLSYILYDCFTKDDKATYKERAERIKSLDLPVSKPGEETQSAKGEVRAAYTWVVVNEEELNGLYKEALDAGYEGVIIRKDAQYELSYNNRHSKNLLKKKPEADAEYELVSWKVGDKGKTLGAFIAVCKTASGHQFGVTPAMPIPDRIELARKMGIVELNGQTHFENEWKGKKITIKFASLSMDGVPLQPRTTMHVRVD